MLLYWKEAIPRLKNALEMLLKWVRALLLGVYGSHSWIRRWKREGGWEVVMAGWWKWITVDGKRKESCEQQTCFSKQACVTFSAEAIHLGYLNWFECWFVGNQPPVLTAWFLFRKADWDQTAARNKEFIQYLRPSHRQVLPLV